MQLSTSLLNVILHRCLIGWIALSIFMLAGCGSDSEPEATPAGAYCNARISSQRVEHCINGNANTGPTATEGSQCCGVGASRSN